VSVGHAGFRIDRNGDDLFRGLFGNGLDVHATLGRDDEGNAANGAVNQKRQVQLARNVGAVFDVETIDLLASLAGLLGDECVAEHVLGIGNDVLDRLGEAYTALGVGGEFLELALAATASVDLALHDIERAGKLLCSGFSLVSVEDYDAISDRGSVTLQQLLGLIFMNVHAESLTFRRGPGQY